MCHAWKFHTFPQTGAESEVLWRLFEGYVKPPCDPRWLGSLTLFFWRLFEGYVKVRVTRADSALRSVVAQTEKTGLYIFVSSETKHTSPIAHSSHADRYLWSIRDTAFTLRADFSDRIQMMALMQDK